jgi:hypothetical protein
VCQVGFAAADTASEYQRSWTLVPNERAHCPLCAYELRAIGVKPIPQLNLAGRPLFR